MDRRERARLLDRLRRDGDRIARHFGLRYRAIEAERSNVKSRYGICYDDGTIRIRLNHATTRRPLKYSSLVSTLCHELAHLEHFHHGPSFQRFYAMVLEYAREVGIYRPESRRPRTALAPAPTARPVPALLRESPVPAPARRPAAPAPPRGPEQLSLGF